MGANTEVLERDLGSATMKYREAEDLLAYALREMTSEWFYDLELNGAEIEGIGIQGAMELASYRAEQGYPIRLLNGFEVVEAVRAGEPGVQATMVAREGRTSREGVGIAFFPYAIEVMKEGATVLAHDSRADRKALSIAKRNAILDLIPDAVKQTIMAERERAVPLNEARKANELIAARRRNAAPIRTVTPEQLREEQLGPYDTPPKRAPAPTSTDAPATVPQIVQICQLVAHPRISETVREFVKTQLEGLSESGATSWIQILEAQAKEPA